MFGKWFGRRKAVDEATDEPPTAIAPPLQRPTVRPAAASKAIPGDKSATGFDPYNSGAFKRKSAWEKVPRL